MWVQGMWPSQGTLLFSLPPVPSCRQMRGFGLMVTKQRTVASNYPMGHQVMKKSGIEIGLIYLTPGNLVVRN